MGWHMTIAKSDGFVKYIYLLKYIFIGSNMIEKRTTDDVVKKDREYWTTVMDDVLIDALLHQQHLGNRNGSVFTTHPYDNIVKDLQEKFEKPIDKQKVKNRIKII